MSPSGVRDAIADTENCLYVGGVETIDDDQVRLIARLSNPPRAKVTLSVDNDQGSHFEIVWAPSAGDELKQEILLPVGAWTVSASAEDQLYQTDHLIFHIATRFTHTSNTTGLTFSATETRTTASLAGVAGAPSPSAPGATIAVYCRSGTVPMDKLTLDPRRAAAASTARGLLDQSVPAPVSEALALLGEIAVARAKAGAMDLVREKFVGPMCDELTLKAIRLNGSGRAFPRACALLETMRIEDVLSAGRSLVEAAGDDLRLTIAPLLIDRIPGVGLRTKELAKIALSFANRIIEGEAQQVAEVDLLIALVDRVLVAEGLGPSLDVLDTVRDMLKLTLADTDELLSIKRRVVELALPTDFDFDGDKADRPWQKVVAGKKSVCVRTHPSERTYVAADRDDCIDAILDELNVAEWWKGGERWLGEQWRTHLLSVLLEYLTTDQAKDLVNKFKRELPSKARESYCAGRVILSVAKWCSSRDRCSAGDIGKVIDRPWSVFAAPSKDDLDQLCWEDWRIEDSSANAGAAAASDNKYFAPFGRTAEYTEMAASLVSFLAPVPAGQERARTVAMVRWLFKFVSMQRNDRNGANDRAKLRDIQEIVERLIDRDYVRALGQSVDLAERLVCSPDTDQACEPRRALRRTAQLLGAVASYARTYEETKSLDTAEARKARKQALEALIDAATDRSGRDGDTVWSFGSPVGFSLGGRWTAGGGEGYASRTRAFREGREYAFHWRVPLSLVRQALPKPNECWANFWIFQGTCGTHLAFSVADLGQFARSDDDLRWRDFLGIGLQAGMLLGSAKHSMVLAAEVTWAPGQYERELKIDGQDTHLSGAFTAGFTLAYYVPFFDLN